jgi:hypothetical protein
MLIVFSLHRESLKLILVDEPLPEVVMSQRGVAMAELAHRPEGNYCSPTARVIAARARPQGGEDHNGGLHLHPSSGQGSGPQHQPCGGQNQGHVGQTPEHLTSTYR